MLSVVCPFFNEKQIIEKSVLTLLGSLEKLQSPWELILVDDGSSDGSSQIALDLSEKDSRIKLLNYKKNMGRGYALKQGIDLASGNFVLTMEIDSSWGPDIVARLYKEITADQSIDIVVASTNMKGGGYINVPAKRILISKIGNKLLRFMVTNSVTMFTGMTRIYRSDIIKYIPASENGKEFHLDILIKALALGYKVTEIPATITWNIDRLSDSKKADRKSSSNIPRLIKGHLIYCLIGQPFKYIYYICCAALIVSIFLFLWGVLRLVSGEVSIFLMNSALIFFLISTVFGGFGIVTLYMSRILKETWLMRIENSRK